MKKILIALVVVLLLCATVTGDTFAKPASCANALRQCGNWCKGYYGVWIPLVDSCETGCAIAYLFC
jgi:hypothetical protein